MKIGIVGMGWVGSSVAISTLNSGIASELVVVDSKPGLAEGEALDLSHGSSFFPTARVRAGDISDLEDADAVVISAGRGGSSGESRLQLLSDNAGVVASIAGQLSRLRGLLIVVTNPVDVMTQVATEASGLSPERVLGTGTMLDTARLRHVLGRCLEINPRSVHAHVVGEHGDSEVVLWSQAHVGGLPLSRWPGWDPTRQQEVATEVRTAAEEIIRRKGATNHAIGLVTAALLRWALRGDRRVLTVSRVQQGAFGLSDVALSLPAVVTREGAVTVLEPDVTELERQAILQSAQVLGSARDQLASSEPS